MDRLTAILLKPSQITVYLHGAVLLLALVALWLCGLMWWWKLIATVTLLAAALWRYKQHKQLPVAAIGCEQGEWWGCVDEQKTFIELVSAQLVLSWLVVLRFRIKELGEKNAGKKYTLVLWPDTASAEDLRRLRVCLRYG